MAKNPLIPSRPTQQKFSPVSSTNLVNQDDYPINKAIHTQEIISNDFLKDGSPLTHRSILQFNKVGGFEGVTTGILSVSASGWDQQFREVGNVLFDKDLKLYIMIYSGYIAPYAEDDVYLGIATSTDGITWTKGGESSDGRLQTITRAAEDPYLVKHLGTYYLYCEDKEDVPFRNIRLYTSTDLTNWTDRGDVLDIGSGSSWDSVDVSSPTVLVENGIFYLFYEGRKAGQEGAVGLATSTDGLTFTKNASNPRITGTNLSSVITWADHMVPDDIFKVGNKYYMTFHANDLTQWQDGMAVSSNLTSWKDYLGSWIENRFGYAGDLMVNYDGHEWVIYYIDTGARTAIYRGYPIIKNDFSIKSKPLHTTGGITDTSLTASKPVFTDANKKLSSSGTVPIANGGTGSTTYGTNKGLIYYDGSVSPAVLKASDQAYLDTNFITFSKSIVVGETITSPAIEDALYSGGWMTIGDPYAMWTGECIVIDSATGTTSINSADLQINGTSGFTGTGAYTNFTIQNGIITAAS